MQIVPGAEPLSHDGSRVGVLVQHGFTGHPGSMRGIAERCVEQGWSVRLPRLPGHGTTWQDLNTRTWPEWYAEVAAAFAELRERCDVVVAVGMSMGGSLVTLLAEEQGDALDGLALINPAYKLPDPRLRVVGLAKYLVPSLAGLGDDIKKPGVTEGAYDRTRCARCTRRSRCGSRSPATCRRSPSRCCCCTRPRTTPCTRATPSCSCRASPPPTSPTWCWRTATTWPPSTTTPS
nr:alpha/beta fold hydrolase [Barrientosiimonas endolithica]